MYYKFLDISFLNLQELEVYQDMADNILLDLPEKDLIQSVSLVFD